MTSRSYFGKMNSTLGSVVPLAMFKNKAEFVKKFHKTHRSVCLNDDLALPILIAFEKLKTIFYCYPLTRGTDGWSEGTPGPLTGCDNGKHIRWNR